MLIILEKLLDDPTDDTAYCLNSHAKHMMPGNAI